MLVIRCAACRRKLWRYQKIGKGALLRCHKARIDRVWHLEVVDGKAVCACGQVIGIDKDGHFRMVARAFTAAGTKQHG